MEEAELLKRGVRNNVQEFDERMEPNFMSVREEKLTQKSTKNEGTTV